ncbi:MAG: glutaredoxin family protein [Chthoniobacterales bacterium]
MENPILYVKRGCPYCIAATDYLDDQGISYDPVEVRGDEEQMKKLQDVSGQSRTPTMVWNGDVLANFGTDQLPDFLAKHQSD